MSAQNTSAGWHGLRFLNTNLRPADSSKLVYCRLEYGRAVGATNPEKEGGAIRLENSSNVVIDRCWFRYNYADNDGGAIIALAGSNILIDNSLFTANRAYFYGGAFMCRASRPLIRNSVFLNDSVTIFGAGVSGWDNSVLRLENVRIANCQAGAACGIYTANNTTITVVNALLTGNSSTLGYGGGAGFSVSTATLINVTMANNTAAQGGGAAWIYQSTVSVTNSIGFCEAMRSAHDASLTCLSSAGLLRDAPHSLHVFFKKRKKRSNSTEMGGSAVNELLISFWEATGSVAKDYRDCLSHYVSLSGPTWQHSANAVWKQGEWTMSLHLPDNPQARTYSALTFSARVDALLLCKRLYQETEQLVRAILIQSAEHWQVGPIDASTAQMTVVNVIIGE